MKVALISYEPDNYNPDELDDMQVGDFDPNDVKIYDLNKVDEHGKYNSWYIGAEPQMRNNGEWTEERL